MPHDIIGAMKEADKSKESEKEQNTQISTKKKHASLEDVQRKHELPLGFFALIYAMFLIFVMINSAVGYFIALKSEGWAFFCMFTYQTNFFIMLWLLCFGITRFKWTHSRFSHFVTNRNLMTALTIYITLTFFIVALVLDPLYKNRFNPVEQSGFFTHNLTPVIMWLYFFLVPGHGKIRYRNIPYILIYPAAYLILSIIIGASITMTQGQFAGQSAYAYGFIDYNTYPHVAVFVTVLMLIGAALAGLCFLLMRFKKFLIKHYYEYED